VARVGETCSAARAQVAVSTRGSTYAAPVVQQVAYCYLQFLGLGGGGWGRKVRSSEGLGGPGSEGGWVVYRGGRGRMDPVGAKASEKGGDIARVRESFEGSVVVDGKAKKFG
jgi:hypothetical protein